MATIKMTNLWDPNTQTFTSVNPGNIDEYKSKGLTDQLPSYDQIKQLQSSAKNGVQAYYSPGVGISTTKPTTISQPTSQQVIPTQGYATSTASQLSQLKKAQLSQAMAGLDKQRQSSLSNLSAEKATIEPAYQKQKIAADVTAQQGARSFDEYMAQRGGGAGKSGIAGQGTLMNNLGYQGQVGSLNEAEAGAISDNARRVTGVQNNYESDVVGAQAGIESQYLQNYINQMNQDRTFNYGVSRDNVVDDRYNTETAYNRGRDGLIDSRYLDETTYGRGRDSLEDTRYNDTTTYARQQDELNRVLESQKLAESAYKASQPKAISQSSPTARTNMDDAIISVQEALRVTSPGNVAADIESKREQLKRQGINVDTLVKEVWRLSGVQTKPEAEDPWR